MTDFNPERARIVLRNLMANVDAGNAVVDSLDGDNITPETAVFHLTITVPGGRELDLSMNMLGVKEISASRARQTADRLAECLHDARESDTAYVQVPHTWTEEALVTLGVVADQLPQVALRIQNMKTALARLVTVADSEDPAFQEAMTAVQQLHESGADLDCFLGIHRWEETGTSAQAKVTGELCNNCGAIRAGRVQGDGVVKMDVGA